MSIGTGGINKGRRWAKHIFFKVCALTISGLCFFPCLGWLGYSLIQSRICGKVGLVAWWVRVIKRHGRWFPSLLVLMSLKRAELEEFLWLKCKLN